MVSLQNKLTSTNFSLSLIPQQNKVIGGSVLRSLSDEAIHGNAMSDVCMVDNFELSAQAKQRKRRSNIHGCTRANKMK